MILGRRLVRVTNRSGVTKLIAARPLGVTAADRAHQFSSMTVRTATLLAPGQFSLGKNSRAVRQVAALNSSNEQFFTCAATSAICRT